MMNNIKQNINDNRNTIKYPYSSKNLFSSIGHNFYMDIHGSSNYEIYEEKLRNFVEGIKENKIKYNSLKILFEYEDNFKLVLDIYQKYTKTDLEFEILNFYLKSLGNFISLIHSDEPISQLDNTLTTVNKYLKVKTYNKNSILFRTGDIGTKYYILLKGKGYTLVPRRYKKLMTFEEYKNHLYILYIFGEDYLLEQTIYNNTKTCEISFSDIDTLENRNLKNIYKSNYSCNYDKYIRIINGDEHIMIEDYIFNNDDEDGKEINIINKYEEKEKEKEKNNKNVGLFHIDIQSIKQKKGKYHKIQNFFKTNFITENKKKINIKDTYNRQLELVNELNEKDDQANILEKDNYYKKLRERLRSRRNRKKVEEQKYKEINSLNIGIPKELLNKDISFNSKNKYDGGDLPTFFAKDRNNNELDEKYHTLHNNDNNKNKNNTNNTYYNQFANQRRNFIIVGYTIVGTILPGMSFGEISLLSKNHKRTSTLFVGEESQIGCLNIGEYNITIKTVRTKIRTNSINFLLSTKLFGDISYNYFLKKYWIYFQCKKIQKGEFLFKIGEECESIYIIYNGEIKLNAYIDKDNIDELIKGIKKDNNNHMNYYINQIHINSINNNINNNNNSSIFEKKQKFCLMIGKKGDILGLNDIINYQNNKYICEGEVLTESLSYYEINKNLIFGEITNINNNNFNTSLNNTFNFENIDYIMKAKEEFMINRLRDIKNAIEQKCKYLKSEEENNLNKNKEMTKIKNKNKLNKIDDNRNYSKLNNNRKSLTLNSYNIQDERENKIINYNNKQIISTSFFQFEKMKESITNFMLSQQILNKRKLSDNDEKYLSLNKIIPDKNLNSNNASVKAGSVPKIKIKTNLRIKKDFNFKNTININSNLSLDMNNTIKDNQNKYNTEVNYANTYNTNNISKINTIINNIDENETNNNNSKLKNYNYCKPYEFPKIQNDNNNENNMESLRKIKILKFLFLTDNNQKLKQFKFYKPKKTNDKHNYFINTIRSSNIKSNNNNIETEINTNKDKYIRYYINTDNFKSNKNELKPLKLNIKAETIKYNYDIPKDKKINFQKTYKKNSPFQTKNLSSNNNSSIIKNNNNSLINKNAKVNKKLFARNRNNSPFINYQKDSLLNNIYNSINHKSREKNNNDLLPYIEKSKLI